MENLKNYLEEQFEEAVKEKNTEKALEIAKMIIDLEKSNKQICHTHPLSPTYLYPWDDRNKFYCETN